MKRFVGVIYALVGLISIPFVAFGIWEVLKNPWTWSCVSFSCGAGVLAVLPGPLAILARVILSIGFLLCFPLILFFIAKIGIWNKGIAWSTEKTLLFYLPSLPIFLAVVAGILVLWRGADLKSQRSIPQEMLVAAKLKTDLRLLDGTAVSIRESDSGYYLFGSSDGESGILGIARLEDSGHFVLVWSGQEAPDCSTFPKEVPTKIMSTCFDYELMKERSR